jgi:hypothetical protein
VPVADVIAQAQREGLRDAEDQLRELIQRGVVESSSENPDLVRFRVPLYRGAAVYSDRDLDLVVRGTRG